MNWIMAFGVVVLGLLVWNLSAGVQEGEPILNHRERRQVKRFYNKKKNRNKQLILETRLGETMSPKEYGTVVAGKQKRK